MNEEAPFTREEFEAQVKEMRREKNRAEEELENASERWRAERRKLNSEIDRLEEEAIARARKPAVADTEEIELALEEKFRQATATLESECERLKSEIARLQNSLADALARSSNPLRTTQRIKDQYETKLADANRVRLEAEREFLRLKSDWDEDKKRIMGELIRLRKLLPSSAVQVNVIDRLQGRADSVEEARIRELEGQLAEARSAVLRSHELAIRSAQESTAARNEVEKLNARILEMSEHMGAGTVDQLRHQYDSRVQDLMQERERLVQELASTRTSSASGLDPFSVAPLLSPALMPESGPTKAEVNRVESDIRAIEKLLDDPDTSASTIAQKNAERTALEAYLRGLLFQSAIARGA